MPRLAARCFNILHHVPATIGTCSHPQWPSMCALVARSQGTVLGAKTLKTLMPLDSAILIPASVQNTEPEDVFQLVQPVHKKRLTSRPFCVVLVTPSFAQWLKDDAFLRDFLRRAYSNFRIPKFASQVSIDALCAVVNKLPAGQIVAQGHTIEQQVMKRAIEAHVNEIGFEGIAYAMLPLGASAPSIAPFQEEGGALDFVLGQATADEPEKKQVIRVPLANTIFQTGSTTTMSHSVWKLSHGGSSFKIVSKQKVSHHGIRIATTNDIVHTLSIPALPLTFPRRIEGCLGNIIRQISSGPENNVATASSELEETVPMFFKSRGESTQATTVWALIIPKAMSEKVRLRTESILTKEKGWEDLEATNQALLWQNLWQENPPMTNSLVSTALAEGARLHRVLSGGGGWGKKAGLLSLDPVQSSGTPKSNTSADPLSDPGDLASALTPVAQVGDFVQFFISSVPKISAKGNQSTELERLMRLPRDNSWGLELGTIPSTIDSTPGDSWQHATTSSEEITVFRNTFGVLTEGGLTITKRFLNQDIKPFPLKSVSFVDVPFSRFWAVGAKEMGASETTFVQETEERGPMKANSMQWNLNGSQSRPLSGRPSQGDTTTPIPPETALASKVRIVMSNEPFPDRFLNRGDARWRLVNRRARGIEGMIRRLRVQTKEIVSNRALGLRSNNGRMKALTKPSETKPTLWRKSRKWEVSITRKVLAGSEFESHAARDGLEMIRLNVDKLAKKYRGIMRIIVHQNVARSFTALGPQSAVARVLDNINSTTQENERLIDTFGCDSELIGSASMPRHACSPIEIEVSSISINMKTAQMELAKLLQWISQRSHLILATNKSALRIYETHVALRWQLGHMIRHRIPHKAILSSEIRQLESRIFVLRDYHGNLLCNRPGIEENQVKKYLTAKEMKNSVQRRLGPKMMDKQSRASRPLIVHSRMRKSYAGPLVHAQVTRRPLIRQGDTRRSRRRSVVVERHTSYALVSKQVPMSRYFLSIPFRSRKFIRIDIRRLDRQRASPSSISAKETATAKRKEDFTARVDSWLRGTLYGPDEDAIAAERTDTKVEKLFSAETGTNEEMKSGQKKDPWGRVLD